MKHIYLLTSLCCLSLAWSPTLQAQGVDSTRGCPSGPVSFTYTVDSSLTVHLTASPNDSGLVYTWTFGDGLTGNGRLVSHTYATQGTYTVSLLVRSGQDTCTAPVVQQRITVGTPPPPPACSVTISAQRDTGRTYTFSAHASVTDSSKTFTYQWLINDTLVSIASSFMHTFPRPGTYQVCVNQHSTDSTCNTRQCVSITVPGDTVVTPPPPTCNAGFSVAISGNTAQFVPVDTVSGVRSVWYFGDNSAAFTGISAVHTYAGPGTYTVRHYVSDTAIHCQDSSVHQITIAPPACSVTISAQRDTGRTYTFSAHASVTDSSKTFTYQWLINDTLVSTAASFMYTFPRPGAYQVCVNQHSTDSTCNTRQCVSIAVPGDTVVTPPPPTCNAGFSTHINGDSVQFVSVLSDPAATSVWYFGDNSASFTGWAPLHVYPGPGTYTVRHYVSDTATHCQDSSVQQITLGSPACSVMISALQDSGRTFTFSAHASVTDSSKTFTYQWMINDTLVSTAASFTYTFPSPGTYQLCVNQHSTDSTCNTQQCMSIVLPGDTVVTPPPPVDTCSVYFTYHQDTLHTGQVDFHAIASPVRDSITYSWTITSDSTAGTPPINPVILSGSDPTYTFADTGSYLVILWAVTHQCSAIATQVINVRSMASNRLTAFPNPVREVVHVNLTLPVSEPVHVTLFSAQGSLMGDMQISGVRGQNTLTVPVRNLPRGIYFMHLQYGNKSSESRFQKL